MNRRIIEVSKKDLPVPVRLTDEDTGQTKLYQLQPAGKRVGLGMLLVGIADSVKRLFAK